jgi:uncharacterized surface protein with fasciclin (FAS1) repeats
VVHVIDAVLVPEPDTTVWDIVVNSEVHTTLETLVDLAGLDVALDGDGPITLFAPTDAAFALLPQSVVDALVADPTGALTDVLLYHVVGAQALSTDLTNGQVVTTLNGETVTVTINADGVFINDAQVILADIITDNGVVHVIDAVLVPATPEPDTTVWDIVVNSAVHATLESLVELANLDGALDDASASLTLFAPTDAAFALLPQSVVDALVADPTGALSQVLLYHVVGSTALSTDLTNGQIVTTLNGETVTVTINADGVFINESQVIVADIVTDNGVVHVIDAVLVPTTLGLASAQPANFEIFPNPASDIVTIRSEVAFEEVRILDLNGRLVKTSAVNGDKVAVLNVSDLNSGVYFLEIRNAEGTTFQKLSVN